MNEGIQTSETVFYSSASSLPASEVKSPTAFRTISEVAEGLAVPQHVLRFWESKFQQIKPLKRGGGRRYYRPEDVKIIHDIKELLYNQGFTIRGVQKLLREGSGSTSLARSKVAQPQLPMSVPIVAQTLPLELALPVATASIAQAQELSSDKRRELEGVLIELKSIRRILQQSGI